MEARRKKGKGRAAEEEGYGRRRDSGEEEGGRGQSEPAAGQLKSLSQQESSKQSPGVATTSLSSALAVQYHAVSSG